MTFNRILVATDFTDASSSAVTEALAFALRFGADVHLLHVVTEPMHEMWSGFSPAADYVAEINTYKVEAKRRLLALAARSGLTPHRVEVIAAAGEPADEILAYARNNDIDLIVCGTHGRRGIERFVMGSVAERVVRLAECAVLTVGPDRQKTSAAA